MKSCILIILLSILFGCAKKSVDTKEVISINIRNEPDTNLPEVEIKSIVPLETNNSSLIGHIASIEHYSNNIYILDFLTNKSVMVFSNDGRFINKTELGKGPGEMLNPFAFFVDRKNENILVWDQALSSMYKFDLGLNHISHEKYNITIVDFAKQDNDKILVYNHYFGDYTYHLYSCKTNSIEQQFIPDLKYSGVVSLLRSIYKGKRTLLISPYDYNIYQLKDNNVYSELFIDFGGYNISKDDIERSSISDIWKLISVGQKVSSPYEIAENDNFILFHVYYKNDPIFYIHSTAQKNTYRLNDYFINGSLPKCHIRGFVDDDTFYAIVEPKDLLIFQGETGTKLVDYEIDPQQNPFFMTFKIINN